MRRLWPSLLLAAFGIADGQACTGLHAAGAWLRQPPPGSELAAAYFTLINAGSEPHIVTAVSSPDFAYAMLHETRYVEGRTEMRHLEAIEIAPGARWQAAPGGAHVMLGEPRHALALDMQVELSLSCREGAPLSLSLPVRRAPPPAHQ